MRVCVYIRMVECNVVLASATRSGDWRQISNNSRQSKASRQTTKRSGEP